MNEELSKMHTGSSDWLLGRIMPSGNALVVYTCPEGILPAFNWGRKRS